MQLIYNWSSVLQGHVACQLNILIIIEVTVNHVLSVKLRADVCIACGKEELSI